MFRSHAVAEGSPLKFETPADSRAAQLRAGLVDIALALEEIAIA
jgi:hypothetical protein